MIHVGINDITNAVDLLNSVKKIVKQVSDISTRTTTAFSSIIVRKDKKHVEKSLTDANTHLKNYCRQKGISFIENSNIKESHLGKRNFTIIKQVKVFLPKISLIILKI